MSLFSSTAMDLESAYEIAAARANTKLALDFPRNAKMVRAAQYEREQGREPRSEYAIGTRWLAAIYARAQRLALQAKRA